MWIENLKLERGNKIKDVWNNHQHAIETLSICEKLLIINGKEEEIHIFIDVYA